MKQAIQLANLNEAEKRTLLNLDYISPPAPPSAVAASSDKKGVFSSIFRGKTVKHAPTVEGEYADTRHVTQLKLLTEQLIANELPLDKFQAMGPAVSAASKVEAKSVRKFGGNSR